MAQEVLCPISNTVMTKWMVIAEVEVVGAEAAEEPDQVDAERVEIIEIL